MAEALLQVRNASVSFGGLKALDDVDFEVGSSEIVGVIGPNGAGKTTLMDALSRLVSLNPGATVRFAGHDLLGCKAHQVAELGMGRTFQGAELSSRDTLLENVLVGGHLRYRAGKWPWASRAAHAQISATAQGLLRTFGVERWGEVAAKDAPYPIQKRAQICRAMMSRPTLLLLDEPAAGISAEEKRLMTEALLEYHRQSGAALLIIEHDVGFLTSMCHRMIALNFGRKVTSGPVAEVIRHPAVIESYMGTRADA